MREEVAEYLAVLAKSLEARAKGDEVLEDSYLDQLDGIWYFSLSETGREEVSEAVRQYVRSEQGSSP